MVHSLLIVIIREQIQSFFIPLLREISANAETRMLHSREPLAAFKVPPPTIRHWHLEYLGTANWTAR